MFLTFKEKGGYCKFHPLIYSTNIKTYYGKVCSNPFTGEAFFES
jgi:hypothetical protein